MSVCDTPVFWLTWLAVVVPGSRPASGAFAQGQGRPGQQVLAAETDQRTHVHEPIILAVVATRQIGHLRQIEKPAIAETVGAQAIVDAGAGVTIRRVNPGDFPFASVGLVAAFGGLQIGEIDPGRLAPMQHHVIALGNLRHARSRLQHHPTAFVSQQVREEFVGAFYAADLADLRAADAARADFHEHLSALQPRNLNGVHHQRCAQRLQNRRSRLHQARPPVSPSHSK